MIEAEKLTKRYRLVTAVDGLTFTARSGSRFSARQRLHRR
jgi:ABC-type multidrug transport system ATPase subunit